MWILYAYADIGLYLGGEEILAEGQSGTVETGNSATQVMQSFCNKYILPKAHRYKEGNTSRKVKELEQLQSWKDIIEIYILNDSVLFWPPRYMGLQNSLTGEVLHTWGLKEVKRSEALWEYVIKEGELDSLSVLPVEAVNILSAARRYPNIYRSHTDSDGLLILMKISQ